MKLKSLIAACLVVMMASAGFAQKIKVTSGDLSFLKGQKQLNVVYTYEDMGVGKYDTEEEYVENKVAEYNDKEPGKGDEWHKNWLADREKRYKPKFEELMNKGLEKNGLEVGDFPNAEYTLVLNTTFTEPGFNVGVMRKPAYVDYEITFVKTGTDEAVAEMTLLASPGSGGMGYDFDAGFRIQESYAKAGKELAAYLNKKALK